MAVKPEVIGRRYAPLALLVAVQIALVYIAPSTPPAPCASTPGGAGATQSGVAVPGGSCAP